MRRSVVGLLLIASMLVACGTRTASPSSTTMASTPAPTPSAEATPEHTPEPTPAPTPAQPAAEDRDGDFRLSLRSPRQAFAADEPLEIETTLIYDGPEDEIVVVGSGAGLVAISITQLDGPIQVGGWQTADCHPYTLRSDEPIDVPLALSGGFGSDDPLADFYRSFYDAPDYRLPPGRWRVDAVGGFFIGNCPPAPEVDLRASIEIRTE